MKLILTHVLLLNHMLLIKIVFYSETLHAINLTLDKIGPRVPLLYEVQVGP